MRTIPVLVAFALLVPLVPLTLAVDPEETGLTGNATGALPVGRIRSLVNPLSSVPAFATPGGTLATEALTLPVGNSAQATLTPVGGGAAVPLGSATAVLGTSAIWSGRTVFHYAFAVPAGTAPGLYDLTLQLGSRTDTQPRAVSVVAAYAAQPRIAVIGDPQVGDPRAFLDAEDHEEFVHAGEKTMFAFPGAWPAWSDVIAQVNAWNPDFVLITGDVTFGQDQPGKHLLEYETAWEVLQEFTVPTFLSLGNHDGYVQGGVDGFALWKKYFGPLHYSRNYGPNVHLVALNSYDWSEMDRIGIAYGVSAWGGQVRADQMAWLAADLAAYRAANPTGTILTFAHHSPSWVQDEWPGHASSPPNGVPVGEQVYRGAVSFGTTDQGWSGEGRLPVRDLLRQHGVAAHFAGHTHRDRVARDDHGHGIVETTQDKLPGMTDADLRLLHYVFRDNTWGKANQTELAAKLADGTRGPFYVDTTTASSDTKQYWGWRQVTLVPTASGFDVAAFGWTPPSQAWLDANTNAPEFWNIDHAPLGLYSTPTFPPE